MIFRKAEWPLIPDPWLVPIPSVQREAFWLMESRVKDGRWTLYALGPEARGWAVGYPVDGRLFIHYLHGRGLFGRLRSEDLLQAARAEGLKGMRAQVSSNKMASALWRLGFKPWANGPGWLKMELSDGR